MNKSVRQALGLGALTIGLVAAMVLPAGATATVLSNSVHIKPANAPESAITTAGSSFDANLLEAAIQQYNTDNGTISPSPLAAYNSQSSGFGRSHVIGGTVNIGFSDFPLNQGSNCDVSGSTVYAGSATYGGSCSYTTSTTGLNEVSDYVQVPVALGGVAIIYNLGTLSNKAQAYINKYGVTLSGPVLGQIFAGSITSWNAAAIKKLNPKDGKYFPNTAIAVESRSGNSGTTYMFKDYLSKVDPADYPTTPVTSGSAQGCSPTPSAPISYPNSVQFCHATSTFSGSAALATAVSNTAGSIGYVEYGFAELNQLATANLVNASGKTVGISEAGILADANAGIAALKKHGGFNTSTLAGYSINNAVGDKVYPIAGFSYAIVVKNVATAATPMTQKEGITVAKFLEWLTHTGSGATTLATFGQNLARPNGYVGLPAGMEGIAQTLISELNFNGAALLATSN